jgi:hypothetical protein
MHGRVAARWRTLCKLRTKGTADANVLDGLHKIAEASKVRERAPDVWHSYLQQVTQEHGAPESVYVSPEAFAQTFSTPEDVSRWAICLMLSAMLSRSQPRPVVM